MLYQQAEELNADDDYYKELNKRNGGGSGSSTDDYWKNIGKVGNTGGLNVDAMFDTMKSLDSKYKKYSTFDEFVKLAKERGEEDGNALKNAYDLMNKMFGT